MAPLQKPLPRRQGENGISIADLDDELVVLALCELAANVPVAQFAELVLIELADEAAGELRRRVLRLAHSVFPQFRKHVVPISVRRPITRQRLPSRHRAWQRAA